MYSYLLAPTTNGGTQNGSSVGKTYTFAKTFFFARLAPTCMLSRCLLTKISDIGAGSEVCCWLGLRHLRWHSLSMSLKLHYIGELSDLPPPPPPPPLLSDAGTRKEGGGLYYPNASTYYYRHFWSRHVTTECLKYITKKRTRTLHFPRLIML